MPRAVASTLFALAACGGSSSKQFSDARIDSPPDVRIDGPPPPAGHAYYVIDHENVPTNNTQARAYGLDLNADGTVDNQLGMVYGTLSGMGFDIQAEVTKSIDTGETLLLADLYALDFQTTTGATFTTYDGANPDPSPCYGSTDTTCRHHLAGNGRFDIAASSPRDTPLAGDATAGTFMLGPGNLELQLAMVSGQPPIHYHLIGARVKLGGVTSTSVGPSIIAGAVTMSDLHTMVYPQMATAFQATVLRDCCGSATSPGGATCNPTGTPSCGCVDGSTGKTALGLFDTSPKDCIVTATEIENNSLIMSLFAPDVTIDGQQATSIGIQVTGVHAEFR